MDKQQAWQKIKSLCPDIEPNDKLAWQLKQNKQWILSNQACQRIAAYNKIIVTYSEPKEILGNIYLKATAKNTVTGLQIESFGETSSKNTHNAYPLAMAEKSSGSLRKNFSLIMLLIFPVAILIASLLPILVL